MAGDSNFWCVSRKAKLDNKLFTLLFTIVACVLLAFYVGFIRGEAVVYTHLFYIPILLAGVWYCRKAVYVALFLGMTHILMTYFSLGYFVTGTFERAFIFIVVAYVLGLVCEKKTKSEEETVRERDKSQKILDTVSEAISIFDRDLNVIEVNGARLKIFDVKREDVIGKKCYRAFWNREEICDGCPVPAIFETGKGTHTGKVLNLTNGTKKYVDIMHMPIFDEQGNLVQVLCDMRDLTEHKEMAEKLLRTERLATIGEFSSGVAHELRQPLGVISNSAYFIGMKLKDIADEKVNRHLAILDKEVKRANRLITDLLEFARVPVPTLNECDINQVVEEALSGVDIPPNVEVKKELKGDLPKIHADFDQIQRTCLNIIANAILAMPGSGSLKIKTGEDKEEGNIEISIADTGEGIPEENREKIFEPLFTTKPRGVGLGLSLCKKYVEAHGGKIEVESEVGKGTTFIVKLPVSEQEKNKS
ncbi:MAG: ATP-binding protein [Euryarchaeota archaeon]|nr:ATP-binding protein [Euryarchaeota archaeon]